MEMLDKRGETDLEEFNSEGSSESQVKHQCR